MASLLRLLPRIDGADRQTPETSDRGPIYASVRTPFGERILSDELNHRLLIEDAARSRVLGEPGRGALAFQFPRGLAYLAGPSRDASRLFVCDSWNHRLQIFDGNLNFVAAFGGHGVRPGQFDVPSDVAIVYPWLPGDRDHEDENDPLLAVADRNNHRVQILTADGVPFAQFGHLDGFGSAVGPVRTLHGASSPTPQPVLRFPGRLAWSAPYLDIVCADARVVRVALSVVIAGTSGAQASPAECA